jgi:hypothetical protein
MSKRVGGANPEATATDVETYSVDATLPTASITLDANITADDIIDATEAGQNIAISGTVGGDVGDSDTITLTVNGNDYTGTSTAGNFTIDVAGADLAADTSIAATVTTSTGDVNGEATANDTETYTVIHAPTAQDNSISLAENSSHVLTAADFGFSDVDGDTLASVKITNVAAVDTGRLLFNSAGTWQDVTADQIITKTDIDAGNLLFRPADNSTGTPYDSFDFTVNDGAFDSVTSNTITYNVGNQLSVSDPAAVDEGRSAVFMLDLVSARAVDTVIDLTIGGDVTADDYDTALYYKDIAPDGQSWSWTLASGNQVTIAAGDTRVEVKVITLSDAVSDNAETLSLTAAINGYAETDMVILADTGTTTINDYPTLLVSAPVFVSEGNDAVFEVGLSSIKTTDTVVDLSIGGSAVAADYNAVYQYSTDDGTTWADVAGDQITIPGNAAVIASVLVKITTVDDAVAEGDETLTLTATTNAPDVATAGIANAGINVSDSTPIIEKVFLSVSEEADGVALIGTTTVATPADANYTYTVLGQGAHGTVTDNGDGTLRYTPDTDYSGTDRFTFSKTDAAGNRTIAEAEVAVTAVADTPDIGMSVNNGVLAGLTEQIVDGTFSVNVTDNANIDDGALWKVLDGPGASGNYREYDPTMDFVATAGEASFAKATSIVQHLGNDLVYGDSYTLSFEHNLSTAADLSVRFVHIAADNSVTAMPFIHDDILVPAGGGTITTTVTIPDTVGDGSGFVANAIVFENTDNQDIMVIDNITMAGAQTRTYDVNIDNSSSDTNNDSAAGEYEILQDVTISGVPNGASFGNATGAVGILTTAGATDIWTFTQAELEGLQITVDAAHGTAGFTLTAATTAAENSNPASTMQNSVSVTVIDSNDTPVIGDNSLIMANESGFVGSVTDTVETYFSTDGGNSFTWDQTKSTLPEIYSEGKLVAIDFDNATGTVRGTIDGGATEVFSVVVNMQDNDATDITYNQPNDLLGIEEVFDGGIVLPGGGNADTIILGFNDSGGNPSSVDAIISAHNLIEDSAAQIASPSAEHTVNTNNFYIGVNSNNMNAGDQLVMDFASVASDGSGNTSHANDVAAMEISLFNFGSQKSGDELYITIITEAGREDIILTSDPDFTELKYTITSATGGAFIGVEFLAGNESSFKLGIESISSINYNTDFNMQLGYNITDVNGDSDSGSVTVSLDGDENILYDSSKTAIDAGVDQADSVDDSLVLNLDEAINFAASETAIPELGNFEIIDLTRNGDHALTNLSVADVTRMTDARNALVINADAGDSVQLTNEWTQIGTSNVYQDATTNINVTINGITPTLTSVIIDAPIIGMTYETASGITGTTNALGGFSHISGDIVTFKLGGMTLGVFDTNDMANDGQLFLQDLAGVERTNLSDQYVVNLAILLQSIDENGIAEDGLVISEEMHQAFADEACSLSSLSESQLIELIEDAGLITVTAEQAMAHVQDELIERTDLTEADFSSATAPDEGREQDLSVTEAPPTMEEMPLLIPVMDDIIRFELGDADQSGISDLDSLVNFNPTLPEDGGEILDLRDLLQGEEHSQENLADYLHFELSGSDTIVHVSSQGNFSNGYAASQEDQTLTLHNVDFDGSMSDRQIIQDMLTKGKLITD